MLWIGGTVLRKETEMAEFAGIVLAWMIIIPLGVAVVRFWCRAVMWGIRIVKAATGEIARHAEA